MRLEISYTFLFRAPVSPADFPSAVPGAPFGLMEAPSLILETDMFGVITMSPRGIEVADGRRRARLVRVEELGVPGTHLVAIEFEYSESVPLELRLGAPALKGRIRARVTGLRAIHALRVDHRETIVHLRHTLGKNTAPCELRCPNGVSAQGPNHCLDCETAIGIVTICC